MYFRFIVAVLSIMIFSSRSIFAADLVSVYHDALVNDPTFKRAEATFLANKQLLPIARAGYEPQFNVTGSVARTFNEQEPFFANSILNTNGWINTYTYTLTLTQPIFNAPSWFAIRQAKANVKAASATYLAAAQDLMQRTVQRYLAVLQAYDQLRYDIENKRAVLEQLRVAQQQFKVGLIAITGVYDAQSVYDQAVANEINDRNNLNVQLENLRAITCLHYSELAGMSHPVPLVKPYPEDIAEWEVVAERQNFAILAQNYTVIAARENVKAQVSGVLPVVSGFANYNKTMQEDIPHNNNLADHFGDTSSITANVGLQASWPMFQNGLEYVPAVSRQARWNYVAASDQLDFVHRDVINKASQAFLGVLSGISQIQADKETIISAQKALEATKAGYQVGTRTMVDVLNALSTLYRNLQKLATDQYNYLLNTINLKQAAGTLSVDDLEVINHWLNKHVVLPISGNIYGDLPTTNYSDVHTLRKEPPKPVDLSKSKLRETILAGEEKPLTNEQNGLTNKPSPYSTTEWMISVYGTNDRTDAIRFLSKLNEAYKFEITKVGERFEVTYGHFTSESEAKEHLQKNSNEFNKYKPEIIRVRS